MRLKKARVTKYRSIRDSGWFDVEHGKTILVGPNEAGKTALLQALQQVNPPKGARGFDPLRDYPRSEYNDITAGRIRPEDITVVEAHFALEDADKDAVPAEFRDCTYVCGRMLNNSAWHRLEKGPPPTTYGAIKKDLARLSSHVDSQVAQPPGGAIPSLPSAKLAAITDAWNDTVEIAGNAAELLTVWLKQVLPLVDESKKVEERRHDRLTAAVTLAEHRTTALNILSERRPVFILFSNYFRVKPLIHLDHLAQRLETGVLDDEAYDYGNKCLLQLLGFSARELSNLGKAGEPPKGNAAALQNYRDQLDAAHTS